MKKTLLLAVSALFIFSACVSGGDKINQNAQLEMAFPEDSKFVMTFDLSNDDQRAQLEEILGRLPDTGLWDQLMADLYVETEDAELGEEFWDDFFAGKSKLAVAMNFPENFDFASDPGSVDLENDQVEIFVAGEFEDSSDLELLLNQLLEGEYESQDIEVVRESRGELELWTIEEDDFYLVRYGDIFVLTNSAELREQSIERMGAGTGLYAVSSFEAAFENLPSDNLGYFYFDVEGFVSMFPESDREELMKVLEFYGESAELLDSLGAVAMVLSVDEGGFKISSSSDIALSKQELEELIPGYDQGLSLIEKVNSEGLILYLENQDLATNMKLLISTYAVLIDSSMQAYESTLVGEDHELPDPSLEFSKEQQEETYLMVMNQIGATTGLTVDELETLFANRYAFSVSDKGELYPAIAFYVDLNEETRQLGKDFAAGLDSFVVETMDELALLLPVDSEGQEVLKRERVIVEGGVLYKLYIDWNTFSEETLSSLAFVPGFDIREQSVVLYYGVTGNDMLAFALYPAFDEEFGDDVLAEAANYKQAVSNLGDHYGYSVSYLQTEAILDFVERYLDLLNSAGLVTGDDLQGFELYGRQFFGAFNYLITSRSYEDGLLYSDAYLRVQKVD